MSWWYGGSSPHQPRHYVVGPVSADGSEHVAAHDRRAQAHLARGREAIINALVAALLTKQLSEGSGAERPVVQLHLRLLQGDCRDLDQALPRTRQGRR